MFPILFASGDVVVYTYGLAMVVAALLAVGWAASFAPSHGPLQTRQVLELAVVSLAPALVAAKLAVVPSALDPGSGGLVDVVRSSGYVQVGGAAGLLAACLYLRQRRLPVLAALDSVAGAAPLGLAVGRLGCFAAGCCWGAESTVGWAVTYTRPAARALAGVPLGVPLHPTPLYLVAGSLGLFAAVRALARRRSEGAAVAAFLLGDGTLRLTTDLVRGDPRGVVGPLTVPAALALGFVAVGALLAWHSRRRASS